MPVDRGEGRRSTRASHSPQHTILVSLQVFNFDPNIKSKSWEVTQVLEGTHCRQKSNILEMATLTNCIDSFCETEQKPSERIGERVSSLYVLRLVKRRKRPHQEATNGNVFVCSSNATENSNHESVVFLNSAGQQSGNARLFVTSRRIASRSTRCQPIDGMDTDSTDKCHSSIETATWSST